MLTLPDYKIDKVCLLLEISSFTFAGRIDSRLKKFTVKFKLNNPKLIVLLYLINCI